MQAIRVGDVAKFLREVAPPWLAEPWDNVGLLVGDAAAEVNRLMTCLTVTPPVVAEAISQRVNLIVSHHPVLFRAVRRLTTDEPQGRMLLDLITAGIGVYSPHTAYDNAAEGINQQLAEALEMQNVQALQLLAGSSENPSPGAALQAGEREGSQETPPSRGRMAEGYKIVVFVPVERWERVARAIFDAGAGRIGEYGECSFRAQGTGTFFGSEASQPAVGQKGRREEVTEYRLEVLCARERLPQTLTALRAAHPYEEPAYDVYPLWSGPGAQGQAATAAEGAACPIGAGRQGELPQPVSLAELAQRVKGVLQLTQVGVVGTADRAVTRLAVACGSAAEFLEDAARAGCDAFLTGEARFHTLLEAEQRGIGLILAGHYASERFAVERLAERLAKGFPPLTIWASRQERDPLAWV